MSAVARADVERTGATYQACDDMNGDGDVTTNDVFLCIFSDGQFPSGATVTSTDVTMTEQQAVNHLANGAWVGDFDYSPTASGITLDTSSTGSWPPVAGGTAQSISNYAKWNGDTYAGYSLVTSYPPGATTGTFGFCSTTLNGNNVAVCTHTQCCTAHVVTEGPFDDETKWPVAAGAAAGTNAIGISVSATSTDAGILNARAMDFSNCIGKSSGDTCTVACNPGSQMLAGGSTITIYADKNGRMVLPGMIDRANDQVSWPYSEDYSNAANRAPTIFFEDTTAVAATALTETNSGLAGNCRKYVCDPLAGTNTTAGFDYGFVSVYATRNYASGAIGDISDTSVSPSSSTTSFMKLDVLDAVIVTQSLGDVNEGTTATLAMNTYNTQSSPCDLFLWQAASSDSAVTTSLNNQHTSVAYDCSVPTALGTAATGGANGCTNADKMQTRLINGYSVPTSYPPTSAGAAPDFTFICDSSGVFDATINYQCVPNIVDMATSSNDVNTPTNADKPYYQLAGVLAAPKLAGIDFSPCEGLATGQTCYPTCKTGYNVNVADADGFRVLADENGVLYVNNYASPEMNAAISALPGTNVVQEAVGDNVAAQTGSNGPQFCWGSTTSSDDSYNMRCDNAAVDFRFDLSQDEYMPRVIGSTYAELMTMTCAANKCWKGPDANTLAAYPGINWWIDIDNDGVVDAGESWSDVLNSISPLTQPVLATSSSTSFFNGVPADAEMNWGIHNTIPCLDGYSQVAGTSVPTLNLGTATPNTCNSDNTFTISGFTNICEPNVAKNFYTGLNTNNANYNLESNPTHGKEVFANYAMIYSILKTGASAAAVCSTAGTCSDLGNTASATGNRHFNGKDYSSCIGLKSGETCTPVCMAGFATTVSNPDGFTAKVNKLGQLLVGKQDYPTYPVEDLWVDCSGAASATTGSSWDTRACTQGAQSDGSISTGVSTDQEYASGDTLQCTAYTCDADKVINGGSFTNYYTCDGVTSMSSCTVQCGGSRSSKPTEATVTSNYPVKFPADLPNLYADGYAVSSTIQASSMTSDFGSTPTTGTDNFQLLCNADGSFDAQNNFECTPNTCDFTSVQASSLVNLATTAGFDFSSCSTMSSNDTCVPQCQAGWSQTVDSTVNWGAATLSCDSSGTVLSPGRWAGGQVGRANALLGRAASGVTPYTGQLGDVVTANAITVTAHGFSLGDRIQFRAPAGVSTWTVFDTAGVTQIEQDRVYCVFSANTNTFTITDSFLSDGSCNTAGSAKVITGPFDGASHGYEIGTPYGPFGADVLEDYLTCTKMSCTSVDDTSKNPTADYSTCIDLPDSDDAKWAAGNTGKVNAATGRGTNAGQVDGTIPSANTLTIYAHGFSVNDLIAFRRSPGVRQWTVFDVGSASTQIAENQVYCVAASTTNTLDLSTTFNAITGVCDTTVLVAFTPGPFTGNDHGYEIRKTSGGCYRTMDLALAAALGLSDGRVPCESSSYCSMTNDVGHPNEYCGGNGKMDSVSYAKGAYAFEMECATSGYAIGDFKDPDPDARSCDPFSCTVGLTQLTGLGADLGTAATIDFENACIGLENSQQCTLQCKSGYGTSIAGDPFILDSAAQSTVTSQQTAVLHCLSAGDDATTVDSVGNNNGALVFQGTSGAITAADFVSTGVWNNDAAVASNVLTGINGRSIYPVCQHGICDDDNIGSAIPGMNYAACLPAITGSSCTYKCNAGYSMSGLYNGASVTPGSSSLTLQCDANGDFSDTNVVRGDTVKCTANVCQEVRQASAISNVDYSNCYGLESGQKCTPTCASVNGVSYSAVTPASEITLVCGKSSSSASTWVTEQTDPNSALAGLYGSSYMSFQFDGTNTLTCGKTCSIAASDMSTVTANADYSSCANLGDGATCTPTCASGFYASTPASGFTLNCAVTPYSAVDPTLVCTAGSSPSPSPPSPSPSPSPVPSTAAPTTVGPSPSPTPSSNDGKQGKNSAPSPSPAPAPSSNDGKQGKEAKQDGGKGAKQDGGKGAKQGGGKGAKTNFRANNNGKAGKTANTKVAKATKAAKDAKSSENNGKTGKGAKSALASKAATSATAHKPVAYAASGVAVVVVLAAVVALATKHGLGPLSSTSGDVEEGHPLNAPGVHPVYA